MVSIIVPVYNAEKYLPRCIESVLNQTYKDFELILVNDGSTDKSGTICDWYAKKDNRIRVVHKKNGGVSDARNVGIDSAQGQYISFVDSDDWIEENYLESLLSLRRDNEAQLLVGSFDFRDLKISFLPQQKFDSIDFQNPSFEACISFFNGWLSYAPWVKIYERDIIVNNNLKFNEKIRYGEDTLFVYEYLRHCNKIYISKDVLYHYNRLVENSATRKFYNEFPQWSLILIKSFENVLRAINLSDTQKKRLLSIIVISRIKNLVSGIVRSLPREEAIRKIDSIISEFDKWILSETLSADISDGKKEITNAIKAKNAELIYSAQKNFSEKHRVKNFAKRILYKALIPVIERKRDELVSFKG